MPLLELCLRSSAPKKLLCLRLPFALSTPLPAFCRPYPRRDQCSCKAVGSRLCFHRLFRFESEGFRPHAGAPTPVLHHRARSYTRTRMRGSLRTVTEVVTPADSLELLPRRGGNHGGTCHRRGYSRRRHAAAAAQVAAATDNFGYPAAVSHHCHFTACTRTSLARTAWARTTFSRTAIHHYQEQWDTAATTMASPLRRSANRSHRMVGRMNASGDLSTSSAAFRRSFTSSERLILARARAAHA